MSAASIQAEDGISCPSNMFAMVTLDDDNYVCGFIKTNYHAWNKRLIATYLVISPSYRGRGIGRKLMEIVIKRGHNIHGAARVWLEVTNINAPAIKAYLRMVFKICGLDFASL
jgi:ribosomal protein S18 acetylase RimI-like enzyme